MIAYTPKNESHSQDLDVQPSVLLSSIDLDFLIENSIASLIINQTFINKSRQQLEIGYKLPLPDDSVVDGFKVILSDGSILKANVQDLDQALEKYQDSLSQGDNPLISKVKSDKISLLIGNLSSEDTIKVEYSLCFPLLTEGNFWKLLIPVGLIPKKIESSLVFSFKLLIKSRSPITNYSSNNGIFISQSSDRLELSAASNDHSILSSLFWLKYSSGSPSELSLVVQKFENNYFGVLSFIPFPSQSVDVEDLEGTGEYIFLLDRSGSMQGKPIQLVIQSLVIFLQSLPIDSYFNIVSFGSSFEFMFKTSAKLSNETLTKAIFKLEKFEADLIGTDIYSPLKKVLEEPLIKNYPRCIFLLTDGVVDNPKAIVHLISKNQGDFILHGLGIGDSVDKNLIRKVSKAGKGSAFFCKHPDKISTIVIQALKISIVPGRGLWDFQWPDLSEAYPATNKIGTIRYSQRFLQYVKFAELPEKIIKITFFDNLSRELQEIYVNSFHLIAGNCLAKLWAAEKINYLMSDSQINKAEIVSISQYFNVPCKLTLFICVKNNDDPIMGNIKPVKIKSEDEPVIRRCGFRRCRINPAYLLPDPQWFRDDRNRGRSRSRSSSPNSQSEKIKSKLYQTVTKSITFDGFWKYEDFSKLLPSLTKIPLDIVCCDEKENTICTIYIIRFLQKRCQDRQFEWSLIERKALRWLRLKNVEINLITQSIDDYL